ncbi:hypothetical protein AALO_G00007650 [Alosa alosa]|uniref:C2H2-type domain-containing protein n=1 Tax=Alosa alosa TaxID=278164 RepID=A0AAV6HJT1_9TELE|nr:putative peptidyl-tRNA hydrolase PTRHD1 isoform X1 [Alosa alosa]KAG5285806.1 hypothetical protein AALO_G00007650 [Alosa alosa]
MPNRETIETQIASVMEILAKTAVAEICKVVDSGCLEFRVEMCRRQKEIEALRKKVRCLTSTRESWLGLVPPQRRTVGVQVDTEQGVAENQGVARVPCQGEPKSRAAPGLTVKVEQRQGHTAQDTVGQQSPGEEFAVDFSVSEVDFPLWAPDMSGSGGPDCELGEASFSAPTQSPGQTDSSADPHPGVRDADPQFSPSPLEKPSCGVLPAALAAPIKMEHRNQCVSTSRSGKAETTGQDGHTGTWRSHAAEEDDGKHETLARADSGQQGERRGQGEGTDWGAGGRLFLCPGCGQGFPCYQQLQAHRQQHAGERGTKCGMTPVNGAVQRASADKQPKCTEDEDWNCEVERKLQLELQRLQDSFSTQDTEQQDRHSHLTHSQDSTSALTHSQDSTSVLTHTQEPVEFGELQLELKAEREEEEDQSLHQGAVECAYRTGDLGQMEESEFGLGLQGEASGSRPLHLGLKHPAWYCADSLKEGAAFASPWNGGAGAGAGLDPPQQRMLTERPSLSGRGLVPTIPQELAAASTRSRESVFSSGSCLASAVPSLSHAFPSSSSSSFSSSSVVHRRLLATTAEAAASVGPSQRLFRCPSCPKSFGRATDLERHRRIHTGERPFGCGVCGKRFSLRCNLVTHERVHSGSKPFACRHCGKRFAQASNMKAHQRIHTGERPFHCRLCSRSFTQLSSLKTHQRLHSRATTSQY